MPEHKAQPSPVYSGPLDWRLLTWSSRESVEGLARAIIRGDLMSEAAAYVEASTRRSDLAPASLVTELAKRAGDSQCWPVSRLVDKIVEQQQEPFRYGMLLLSEYLMFERFSDNAGIIRTLSRWAALAAEGRVPHRLWLPLLRGEADGPICRQPPTSRVHYRDLGGDDTELQDKVMHLILTDRVSLLSLTLAGFGEGRGKPAKAGLAMCYLLRACRDSQVREAVYLLDEFMPKTTPKRLGQVVNELAVACVRLGDHKGYVDCFRRAATYRRQGLLKPDWSLCPCRFEHLAGQSPLCGSLTRDFG